MQLLFRKGKKGFLSSSILYILLGLVLVLFPQITTQLICYLLGGILCVYGSGHIFGYFSKKERGDLFRYGLLVGMVCISIGLIILLNTEGVISILPMIFGLSMLLGSFFKIQYALNLKEAGYSLWWSVLMMGLVTLMLGILLIFNPFTAAMTLVIFIGISLMIGGATDLWTLSRLLMQAKQAKEPAVTVEKAENPKA